MDKKNVRIRLFKDNSRYKGDLFVSVNGVSYKIRRGVEVEVPPEVAEVLEHSQVQDERTAARIAAAEWDRLWNGPRNCGRAARWTAAPGSAGFVKRTGCCGPCCSPAAGCGPEWGQTLPGLRKEVWTMP